MTNKKTQVQNVFGQFAQNYVTSPTHAKSTSLERLTEWIAPGPESRCLDIATGGGHVARELSKPGAWVIAGDLTHPMLVAARKSLPDHPIQYVQHDAEGLPFPSASLDAVTCRIAPHHFPHVQAFVEECARVLKPGGKLGIVDIISSEVGKEARYTNMFETLRDPSHVWAYSIPDWQFFLESAGMRLELVERVEVQQQVGVWAKRIGCDDTIIERLRVMLLQAPVPIRDWYRITAKPGLSPYLDITFQIQQAIFGAVKI
jgi:ubiquinone/menaquinone biosynthesis C-methylase UbiE